MRPWAPRNRLLRSFRPLTIPPGSLEFYAAGKPERNTPPSSECAVRNARRSTGSPRCRIPVCRVLPDNGRSRRRTIEAGGSRDRGQLRTGSHRTRARPAGENISRRIPDYKIRAARARRAGYPHGPARNNGRPIPRPEAGVKDAARHPLAFAAARKRDRPNLILRAGAGHCIRTVDCLASSHLFGGGQAARASRPRPHVRLAVVI